MTDKYQEALENARETNWHIVWYLDSTVSEQLDRYLDALEELVDKEDKYRWHDLKKDPNDLPETFVDVWICFTDYKCCGDEKFYEIAGRREEDWTWSGDDELLNNRYQIIGWREIDEFK